MMLIGTSGWQYRDWKGRLYPADLPQRCWLEHYATAFATVEVNNAFYRLPERSTFEAWRERTPDDFVVAVKASRYLTHVRRLRDPEEPVGRLMDRARGLGGKLGPVLLQLPPTMQLDVAALDETLAAFPAGVRVAVEPRHETWWVDEVRQVLDARGAALCWADRHSRPVTPLWATGGWGYLRLHEGRATPWPRYGRSALDTWAGRLADCFDDSYVYFNNDPGGAAVDDAVAFARLARRRGQDTTRAGNPATATQTGHRR
ncbi:DUF72 domain-containing protein [Dactylosporangium sp. NPDC000521]|uniref:DUF72 domain-containing protein n=1 Tax=Dactylosporangium sp. NPDC000521 TaxID=3363975 RepID=UPI0036BA2542